MELLLLAALGVVGYLALRSTTVPVQQPVVTNPPMGTTNPPMGTMNPPMGTMNPPVQTIPGTNIPIILSPPGGFPPSGFPAIALPASFQFPTGFSPTDPNTNTFVAKGGDTLAVYFEDAALAQLATTNPANYAANQISEALRQYGFEFQLMNVAGTGTSAVQIPLIPNAWLVAGTLTGGTPRTLPRDLTINPRITVLATRPA